MGEKMKQTASLIRRSLALPVLLLCFAAAAPAEDLSDQFDAPGHPFINAGVFYWSATAKGKAGFPTSVDGQNNTFSFRDDLGYKPIATVPFGRVQVFLSRQWLLDLEYWETEQTGISTLERDLMFIDSFFAAGQTVESRTRARSGDVIVAYEIPTEQNLGIYLAGGVNIVNFEQEVSSGADSRDASFTQMSPLIGFAGEYRFSPRLALSSCTMGYLRKGLDTSEYLLRTDSALTIRMMGNAQFAIGYKSFWFSAKNMDNEFKYRLAGPYAGFSLAF